MDDPHLVVRAASLYVCVALTLVVCAWRRPDRRDAAAAMLAGVWNLPVLMALHVAAARFGWWRFDATGGLLLGFPVDLYLAWAWLWGVLPALAFRTLALPLVAALALSADLVLMPAAAPVILLGPAWLAGELVGLLVGLVPGQLLARWTIRQTHLHGRALLQMGAFAGLTMFVLPVSIVETDGRWTVLIDRPLWQVSVIAQLLAIPAVIGLTAVQEFVERGGGTPVPFDPPRRLVTSGVYAYVRNPMQLSASLVLVGLGGAVGSVWVAAAGAMAHVFSVGLAGWDEDGDLRQRFGSSWETYRQHVRSWLPRLRPWRAPDQPPATLFVSETCGMCSEVARWFARHGAIGLAIVAAESHPTRALTRMTYEPGDGTRAAAGVDALARALEHVHLGWAAIGIALRLPLVRRLAQVLADASGAAPRRLGVRSCSATSDNFSSRRITDLNAGADESPFDPEMSQNKT